MKKLVILLSSFAAMVLTGYSQVETGYKVHYTGNKPRLNTNRTIVQCGPDTLLYPYVKELLFSAPNDSFFLDAMVGNIRTASQGYILNDTAQILGVQFWGGKYSLAAGPASAMVRAYLYAVDNTFKPTIALDSVDLMVTNQYNYYEASFAAPHIYHQNFAVAVKLVSYDTLTVMTNNAGNAWTPNYGESLAWRRFGSGVWNSSASFFGQDLEYMIFPIVSYRIHADMSLSDTLICEGNTVTFTNTSTPVLSNRMFNLLAFEDYWNFSQADSTFKLNFGDSSPISVNPDATHVYSNNGTYTSRLHAFMQGYYSICEDSAQYTVTVAPGYMDTVSASICYGNIYQFGSQNLSSPGVYSEAFTSILGCDSLVTLDLAVDSLNYSVNVSGSTATAVQGGASYQWINCATNSGIPGAVSQTYSPTITGNYAVIITLNSCADTSDCVTIAVNTGLEAEDFSLVKVYPSPTHGNISIDSGNKVPASIVITDMLGKVVKTIQPGAGITTVDLTNEMNGIYIVQVSFEQGIKVSRIIKY